MATSLNGYPVLEPGSPFLYTWVIPTKAGIVRLTMRNGSVGFVLAYAFMLFSDLIEVTFGGADDGGYSYRKGRGLSGWSNHASGSAWDANWKRHPLGRVGTLAKAAAWRVLLVTRCGNLLDWGGDWHTRKDEMHTEVAPGTTMSQLEALAKKRMNRGRGKRLIEANPSQRAVINS